MLLSLFHTSSPVQIGLLYSIAAIEKSSQKCNHRFARVSSEQNILEFLAVLAFFSLVSTESPKVKNARL